MRNLKQSFENFFDKKSIKKVGEKTGFTKRAPKKITPFDFVLGLFFEFL